MTYNTVALPPGERGNPPRAGARPLIHLRRGRGGSCASRFLSPEPLPPGDRRNRASLRNYRPQCQWILQLLGTPNAGDPLPPARGRDRVRGDFSVFLHSPSNVSPPRTSNALEKGTQRGKPAAWLTAGNVASGATASLRTGTVLEFPRCGGNRREAGPGPTPTPPKASYRSNASAKRLYGSSGSPYFTWPATIWAQAGSSTSRSGAVLCR